MKTITLIIITIHLILLMSCEQDTPTRIISYLEDVTEEQATPISNQSFIQNLDMVNHIWTSSHYRYQQITNVDINPVQEAKLPSANEWFSNLDERQADIQMFLEILENKPSHDTSATYPKSSIWIPLIKEIRTLSQFPQADIQLYLISDLKSHNDFINFYSKATEQHLFKQPEIIRQRFREKIPPNLKSENINLTIVYQPKNQSDNQFYRQVVDSVYQPLLSEIGITIKQKATL